MSAEDIGLAVRYRIEQLKTRMDDHDEATGDPRDFELWRIELKMLQELTEPPLNLADGMHAGSDAEV